MKITLGKVLILWVFIGLIALIYQHTNLDLIIQKYMFSQLAESYETLISSVALKSESRIHYGYPVEMSLADPDPELVTLIHIAGMRDTVLFLTDIDGRVLQSTEEVGQYSSFVSEFKKKRTLILSERPKNHPVRLSTGKYWYVAKVLVSYPSQIHGIVWIQFRREKIESLKNSIILRSGYQPWLSIVVLMIILGLLFLLISRVADPVLQIYYQAGPLGLILYSILCLFVNNALLVVSRIMFYEPAAKVIAQMEIEKYQYRLWSTASQVARLGDFNFKVDELDGTHIFLHKELRTSQDFERFMLLDPDGLLVFEGTQMHALDMRNYPMRLSTGLVNTIALVPLRYNSQDYGYLGAIPKYKNGIIASQHLLNDYKNITILTCIIQGIVFALILCVYIRRMIKKAQVLKFNNDTV